MNTFADSARTALALITNFDPGLWTIVARSLAVSATACAIAYGLGLAAGAWLGVMRFRGRGAVLTVLNTLPHAVFPWKALESVALGIPFVVERRPLISMPPELELVPGRHYLELLPELPGFETAADVEDPKTYRLFPEIRLERLRERADWLKQEIRNRDRMDEMRFEVEAYRRRVLNAGFIAQYVAGRVVQAAEKRGES